MDLSKDFQHNPCHLQDTISSYSSFFFSWITCNIGSFSHLGGMLSKRMVSMISKILFNLDVILGGLGWGFLGFF